MSDYIDITEGRGAPVVTVRLRYETESIEETLRAAVRQLEIELARMRHKRD